MDSSCYKYIDKISDQVASELEKRYQVEAAGGGLLYLALVVRGALTQEEARYLLVTAMDLYVEKLNQDPYLRENCSDYPFSLEHVQIDLFLGDYVGNKSLYPNPSAAGNFRDELSYTYKSSEEFYKSRHTEETYAEAKAILAKSGASDAILKADEPFKKAASKVLYDFGRKMDKQKGLEVMGIGMGHDHLSVRFYLYHTISVPEGRALLVEVTDGLLQAINGSPELAPYLAHTPFTRDDIEVGVICNKKKYGDRRINWPAAPYPEMMGLRREELVYRFVDPNLDDHSTREPYDTALKLLRGELDQDEVALFADDVTRRNLDGHVAKQLRRIREEEGR
ncbi:MAG: hypothetical protein AB7F31_00155 [Parachlamydiales bacterium]